MSPEKGQFQKEGNQPTDKSLRKSQGNSVGVRNFGICWTQENESIYIKNLLEYYYIIDIELKPITSKKHFEAISSVKSILTQHHNQNIPHNLPTKKRHIFPKLPWLQWWLTALGGGSRPFQGEFRCLAPSDVRKDLEACFLLGGWPRVLWCWWCFPPAEKLGNLRRNCFLSTSIKAFFGDTDT